MLVLLRCVEKLCRVVAPFVAATGDQDDLLFPAKRLFQAIVRPVGEDSGAGVVFVHTYPIPGINRRPYAYRAHGVHRRQLGGYPHLGGDSSKRCVGFPHYACAGAVYVQFVISVDSDDVVQNPGSLKLIQPLPYFLFAVFRHVQHHRNPGVRGMDHVDHLLCRSPPAGGHH